MPAARQPCSTRLTKVRYWPDVHVDAKSGALLQRCSMHSRGGRANLVRLHHLMKTETSAHVLSTVCSQYAVFYEQLDANTAGNGSRAGILAAQALVLQAQADSLAVANEFGSLLQVRLTVQTTI